MNIVLHPKQASEAIDCAVERCIDCVVRQRHSDFGFAAGHVDTELAVAAYSVFRGIPYERRNNFHGPDVGQKTQIRTTRYKDGRLYLVPQDHTGRQHDKPEDFFVLVRQHAVFEIAGWIRGSDGFKVAVKGTQRGSDPPLYVPNKHLHKF